MARLNTTKIVSTAVADITVESFPAKSAAENWEDARDGLLMKLLIRATNCGCKAYIIQDAGALVLRIAFYGAISYVGESIAEFHEDLAVVYCTYESYANAVDLVAEVEGGLLKAAADRKKAAAAWKRLTEEERILLRAVDPASR